ncbi:MAG: solute:sodium symporter family transporter [Gammaproteobacteria bacterium]|nr:solute:sodium symporter family transporter [Gammaproteobacteria bacterium]
MLSTLGSCAAVMALIAWVSYLKSRGGAATATGYFLAGRGLTGTFIAGSLLLTNLSAEQLIGLNGSAFAFNLSSMAWEVTAVFAMILMAMVLLPRYLTGGFTTLPEFLGRRFDERVRRFTVALFILGYGLVTMPAVLYSGAVAVLQLFDLSALLAVSADTALILTVGLIALVGGLYAIAGGLKAVAVSDTLNGIGLLIIGALVPVLGLIKLGDGSFGAGLAQLLTQHTHKLNAIGAATDPTPFSTLFTGMILANLFYWGTNQYVIQRTLGANSLAEGQKGVLLSGLFKLLIPLFMMIPGVIAFHLYGDSLDSMDQAYPRLAADVLPAALGGFFLAVLLGAVFSSFNSLLNSAATLLCVDVIAPLWEARKKPLGDAQMIRLARWTGLAAAVAALSIAPLLHFADEGLWQVVRKFTGFYNIPIIAIMTAALCLPKAPASAAIVAMAFHLLVYPLATFVWDTGIHFVHLYAILFAIEVAIMWAGGRLRPAPTPDPLDDGAAPVDMTPWRWTPWVALGLCLAVAGIYVLFSPLGLAGW